MERSPGHLSVSNRVITVPTKPYEIKTIKMQFEKPAKSEIAGQP